MRYFITVLMLFCLSCIEVDKEPAKVSFVITATIDSTNTHIRLLDMRGMAHPIGDTLRHIVYPRNFSPDSAAVGIASLIEALEKEKIATANRYDSLIWTTTELLRQYRGRYVESN